MDLAEARRENAKAIAERMTCDYEEQLGRPLTADELAQVHEKARQTTAYWGLLNRRTAQIAAQFGRELTTEELSDVIRETRPYEPQ